MDPASILAIVGGVCMVMKGCIETYESWSAYRQRKSGLAAGKLKEEEDKLSEELKISASKVEIQYNQFVVVLGGGFARSGDGTTRQDFQKIVEKQRRLLAYLRKIQKESSDSESSSTRKVRTYAREIQDDLSKALGNFAQRSAPRKLLDGIFDRAKDQETALDSGRWPRKFCYGALLLQSNDYLDVSTLASDPTLCILGFTCKHCNLEVGDYRMSKWGKTVISTRLLAASHVTSCPSFADRRAAYKCLPCHAKHFDIDFPSAAALEQHLKKHPNNKPLIEMEEKDVMKELNTSPKELGLEPEEESSLKDEALPQEEGSAGTSAQEHSRSFAASIKTTIDNDSISISSIDEPEPRPASYSYKNTGPVLFDNPYQDEAPELEETPPRKEIAELDLYHATHGIPELDSTNHCPSPPPPNELPQTLSRSRPYPPQGPPLDTDYSNLNPQPSNDNPSRSHTPNSSLGAPVFAPQNNIGYQTYTGAQSYQGPPTPNRAPPSQPPYGPDSFLNRGSSESARYQPDINQGPSPSMNDLSQGYSTQQFQEPIWAEPAEKKGARFWKKSNK